MIRSEVRGSMSPALRGAARALHAVPLLGPRALVDTASGAGGGLALVVALRARATPDRVAWIDERGELTWADLDRRIRRAATPAAGLSVVHHDDPRELAIGVLAAMAAGGEVLVVSSRSGGAGLAAAEHLAAERGGSARRHWGGTVSFATSGTTGAPKRVRGYRRLAVPVQLAGLLGMLALPPRPVVASLVHVDHGHGFGLLAATVALGGTFVSLGRDPLAVLRRALDRTGRVDVISGVPRQLADLAELVERDESAARPRVGLLLSGSDLLDPSTAALVRRALGADVVNAYGATETGTVCLATPVDRARAPDAVGRPVTGVRIRVLDAAGAVVPVGVVGRLEVRSPQGGREPFVGDRGFIGADGLVRVLGRADGKRVSGGETVDPAELLAWLRRVPGVRDAQVTEAGDDRFGSRLVAELDGDGSAVLDPQVLRARVRAELGPALTPRSITIRTP